MKPISNKLFEFVCIYKQNGVAVTSVIMEESSATQKEISKRMDNFAVCEKQQQSSKETGQLF